MLGILIAENHDVVRHGMRELLAAHHGWEVVAEARNGRQAVELAERVHPDLAVVDLSLPELSGVETIRQIRAQRHDLPICVFSMHEDEVFVRDSVVAGARAYVLKLEPAARLVEAVEALARGDPYFSSRVADLVLKALALSSPVTRNHSGDLLTGREREVTQLLVEGLGSRAVANRLGITAKTVDTHRAAIMRKLGTTSIADLVLYAIRHRLVEP